MSAAEDIKALRGELRVEWARWLAAHRVKVVPLLDDGTIPGDLKPTTNLAQIEAWWRDHPEWRVGVISRTCGHIYIADDDALARFLAFMKGEECSVYKRKAGGYVAWFRSNGAWPRFSYPLQEGIRVAGAGEPQIFDEDWDEEFLHGDGCSTGHCPPWLKHFLKSEAELLMPADAAPESDPDTTRTQKRRLQSVAEILKRPDPVELVEGFMTVGDNAQLYGPSGVGKSFIALDLGLSVATGQPFYGKVPVLETGPVVYFAGEGDGGLKSRIRAWAKHRGLTGADTIPLYYDDRVPMTAAGLDGCRDYLDDLRERGIEPVLVIIDTMARSLGAEDENAAKAANAYLELTQGLRDRLRGSTILTIHHAGKNDTNRGSSAFGAGFDSVYKVSRDDAGLIKIGSEKMKDRAELEPVYFRLKTIHLGDGKLGSSAALELSTETFRKDGGQDDAVAFFWRVLAIRKPTAEKPLSKKHMAQALAIAEVGEPKSIYDEESEEGKRFHLCVLKWSKWLDNATTTKRGKTILVEGIGWRSDWIEGRRAKVFIAPPGLTNPTLTPLDEQLSQE